MSHESTSHYNIEPDFFERFLDPYLKYTSGYFSSPEDKLEDATRNMLDKIIEAGNLKAFDSILEIGPGWGSLIKRIDERIGINNIEYTGISPSVVQNSYIENRFKNIEPIYSTPFENINLDRKFDSIFLVGSFCHLRDKTNQLTKMNKLLNEKGRVVIEDSFFLTQPLFERHMKHPHTKFVQKETFGWSEIPSLSQFIEDLHDSKFKLIGIVENTLSYKKTIEHWLNRLHELDNHEYPQTKNFIRYLGIAQRSWDYTIGNYLITLEKRG